ncbi:MAG: Hsp20/alpha crystallin family protein [Amaricoccus sp.]
MSETISDTPVESRSTTPAAAGTVSPFEALRRGIDRLFDEFRPAGSRSPFPRPSVFELAWPDPEDWEVARAMDMVEKDDAYQLTAELPGLDEKDVKVTLSKGYLTIEGEKHEEREQREKEYHLSERRYGSFQRMVRVPEGVDSDRIDASYRQGVLTVTLPKSPSAAPAEKRIAVKVA